MSLLWEKLVRPMAFRLDAERAHEIGLRGLAAGLAAPFYVSDLTFGLPPIELFGLAFSNPVGVAAGFDKNGIVVGQLARLGFGFVEVGTVTFHPQPGNLKPRLFRLPADRALINRLGFNNDGARVVAERLRSIKRRRCVIGVNIGRNKEVTNENAVENYLQCFDLLQPVADYIAVNISSPNTPGLRELQQQDQLAELLTALQTRNREIGAKPMLVKIAPDLTDPEIEAIVDVCVVTGISGIIATNTTVYRNGLKTPGVEDLGAGGLSGRPLAARSTDVVSTCYFYSEGRLPIIGVGGILSADDALDKVAAGASLIQTYTGFVYGGPAFPRLLNEGINTTLSTSGFASVVQAAGVLVR